MDLPLPPSRPERVAFLGSPEIAVPTLRAVHDAGYDIGIVVSAPDKRRGRGGRTSATPVKAAALDLGLEVTADMDAVLDAEEHGPIDLGIVVAYGRIIPTEILRSVPMINLHFSKLPRWRGAAPIERAILAGDESTAATVITVAAGLDEGDIWAEREVEIGPTETSSELATRLASLGADLIVDTMRSGFPASVPQLGDPVYAAKLDNTDRELDFDRPCDQLLRVVRIGHAWTTFRGRRLKIWDAEPAAAGPAAARLEGDVVGCGVGALRLLTVQPEGKGPMAATAWINGVQPRPDERLGDD